MIEQFWVELNCRHTVLFTLAPPFKGDPVWCVRCRAEGTVTVAPYEGRARCLVCPYDRRRLMRLGQARTKARAHLRQRPTHSLRLYQGGVPLEDWGVEREPLDVILERLADSRENFLEISLKPLDTGT